MADRVYFNDLRAIHAEMENELVGAFKNALMNSDFVLGPNVQRFEESFAEAHGAKGAVSVGSGTDALMLTMKALGIGSGDSVIVPAFTFAATAEAVVNAGAKPIFVDVDPDTLLIDHEAVERAYGPSVRCIIPVHLYGHVVPLEHIQTWSSEMIVIEDAAQAHLANWYGQQLGSASHAATFSFYPGKNLGALGDGGAVISQDVVTLDRIRMLRDHGGLSKYSHEIVGTTSRLDSVQAAFLSLKLGRLAKWNEQRKVVAEQYLDLIDGVGGIRVVPWSEGSVHHLLVVMLENDSRSRVVRALSDANIDYGIHYPCALTQLPAFRSYSVACPVAEAVAHKVISLPLHSSLKEDEVDRVCAVLTNAVKTQSS